MQDEVSKNKTRNKMLAKKDISESSLNNQQCATDGS
jgi:hypothetical protein